MSDIDFVITWVDGGDPAWLEEKSRYDQAYRGKTSDTVIFDQWNNNPIRYRDWENLQYWFRGVEKFAPWARKIHFVTWGHLPPWLNTEHPKLHIVNHRDYIPEKYLPTFNSNTIENNLHRISGLTEQFVYFNDDCFIIKKTRPTDFFVRGLPCDCAIPNSIAAERNVIRYELTSAEIINCYFSKRKALRKHWRKWFNLKYFPQLYRTFALLPWRKFSGLYQPHLPTSLLKSTLETLWEKEGAELDKTCMGKFRGKEQLSQWVFLDWQRVSGQFYPRSPGIGKTFALGELYGDTPQKPRDGQVISYIKNQKGKMISINDGLMSEEEFEQRKRMIIDAFQTILPEKSLFEK